MPFAIDNHSEIDCFGQQEHQTSMRCLSCSALEFTNGGITLYLLELQCVPVYKVYNTLVNVQFVKLFLMLRDKKIIGVIVLCKKSFTPSDAMLGSLQLAIMNMVPVSSAPQKSSTFPALKACESL